MEITISAALTDDEAELLEDELSSIASQLGIEGIDIAGIEVEGDDRITSLDIFYTESDQAEDAQLRTFTEEIIGEFDRLQSRGIFSTKGYRQVSARVGKLQLQIA